ncbi:cell division protein FtsZ [Lichenifustis flavocetrariae]|uniref:Cell division protein FtsZ n=1 Tax=Lichenifustis flavocetrariae TaxID=2949735 RepID=A0AA41Z185_9HYPH|nr:cell division protein FtsZ [Lichenifustis flavocetrariae]MCW6511111.1 cell division protein FtsZ [Lichenifustis flavocetrariae]
MSINLKVPGLRELKPRIMVCGIGGAGGNAVNNMIVSGLVGVDFIVANTDAQALTSSRAERIIQMGLQVTEGLGAGSQPEVGRAAAEEAIEEIRDHLAGAHMCFVTAGMGGGTGTGAAPVIARTARDMGILTVGVVTKPFQFEGQRRMRVAEAGINELQKAVDTLIVIPNQNLFRVANEKTTFADAFSMADQVLYSGVACITDLMVKEGLINLDFADVRAIMREMGKAMMGTGEASGDKRAIMAAEAAIANPLLDEVSMKGARGLLISITGGNDLTLYEVDEAASRIRQEVDDDANIILGATFEPSLDGIVRVSVVATGIDQPLNNKDGSATESRIAEVASRLRAQTAARQVELPAPAPAPVTEHPAYHEQAAAQLQHYNLAPQAHYAPPPPLPNDVEIHAVQPKPAVYAPAAPAPAPRTDATENGPFVPPMPVMPQRGQRMPQVEDLPLPVQNQIRSQRGEMPADNSPAESKRRTLLERLASFGMSRQDEAGQSKPTQPQGRGHGMVQAPPPQLTGHTYGHHQAPPAASHADYAKRPQAAGVARHVAPIDQHGRQAPVSRHADDDQLEIPAFLRRQSN